MKDGFEATTNAKMCGKRIGMHGFSLRVHCCGPAIGRKQQDDDKFVGPVANAVPASSRAHILLLANAICL